MSLDHDRHAVRERVARLQRRLRQLFEVDGGEELRMLFETELVGARLDAYREGKREGLQTQHQAGHGPAARPPLPPPPPAGRARVSDQGAPTPVRAVDWVDRAGSRRRP